MEIDITKIVVALIGLLGTIVTTFVVPWINTKLKNEKVKTVVEIARQVVAAAHELQITGELVEMGMDKATYAWNVAKKALDAKGIKIDDDELKAAIKAEVTNLRKDVVW